MVFRRALLREFAGLGAAVFTALTSIAVTTRLVRLLDQAASQQIPPDVVGAYLGFFALGAAPMLLALTMFVSVLLTLTRSWRDSEMVVWFMSGLSLAAWLRPVLVFALPQVVVIAALSLVVEPWLERIGEQYRARIEARPEVARVTPGEFHETASGSVYFVESASPNSTEVKGVFTESVRQSAPDVTASREGRIETAANGDRFVVLAHGRRYEGSPGDAQYRVTEFERYAARIQPVEMVRPPLSERSLPTAALIAHPTERNLGELAWRVGIPLSALILVVMAIPISFVNPRAGGSANLALALLTYFVYSNLLSVSQARVEQGRLSFSAALLLVHGGMALLLVLLFAQRMSLIRLRIGHAS